MRANVCARQQGAAAEDAQKVIDDLHRKIGQLQVECDFLAGQPAISRCCEAGDDRAGSRAVRKPAMRCSGLRAAASIRSRPESAAELELLKRLDRIFTDIRSTAAAGCRSRFAGWDFGRPPTRAAADAEARAVGSQTEAEHQQAASEHKVYRTFCAAERDQPNQVWAADITYIPMQQGFLTGRDHRLGDPTSAVWRLSNTSRRGSRRGAERGPRPVGARHLKPIRARNTSDEFTKAAGSPDRDQHGGRGRCHDNIRRALWWT